MSQGRSAAVPPTAPVERAAAASDIRAALHARLLEDVERHALAGQDRAVVRSYLEETLARYLREYPHLSQAETERIIRDLCDDIVGFGPLEPLLRDPHITDIMVNRYDRVYVQRHGVKVQTGVRFRDEDHLRFIIGRVAELGGRRIDSATPMADVRMPQGFRAHAAIPPVAVDGPCLAIRLFPGQPLTLDALVERGAFGPEVAEYLTSAVRQKATLLFTGGTGAGKTSLLNACAAAMPAEERVVSIEEAAELRLPIRNWIRWETRAPNIEGRGEITPAHLVRHALRQNPDRIIVGEVRGGEALDMLQAMNTGHRGSMSTLHANSPAHALDRLEVLARWDSGLPGDLVRRLIAGAIDVLVHLERRPDGRRAVVEVSEVTGADRDAVQLQSVFRGERGAGVLARTSVPSRLARPAPYPGAPYPALDGRAALG
ncbi:MAG TPA: CpaF family protein [bacterium]|nr:CpaF family protein [bacterium]